MPAFQQVCREIIAEARQENAKTLGDLNRIKMKVLNRHPSVHGIPNNADLIVCATPEEKKELRHLLVMKPMRTISGVSPIALMTDPYPCPHTMKNVGPCTYCPGGPGSPWGDVPQSYTGAEPSTRRSARNHYDPYIGVFNRLEHYLAMNHSPEKVEIILQGGTFCFFPKSYQEYFVTCVFKAMNDFSRVFYPAGELDIGRFSSFFELPLQEDTEERTARVHKKCLLLKNRDLRDKDAHDAAIATLFTPGLLNGFSGNEDDNRSQRNEQPRNGHAAEGAPAAAIDSSQDANVRAMRKAIAKAHAPGSAAVTLEAVQEENETAKIRCVGLTIETKSDYGRLAQGNGMLRLGCTRVELGIQTIYDEVLEKTHRGNTVQDNIDSIRILKDLGFKINAHIMPGLPHTTEEMDRAMLKAIFENEDYRPDMLKIYPCMVMEGTRLHQDFKSGAFVPLTTGEAAERIAWFKQFVPEYCRIMRVQRDIPTFMTGGGVDKTNLRQYIDAELKKQGITCRCIRCREPGHQKQGHHEPVNPAISITEYGASGGKEFFIAYEDKESDILLGYCRLRFPSRSPREEITPASALLRELHVFGRAVPVGGREEGGIQHKGIGRMLLARAEETCARHGKDRLVVISGVGVREYYRKIGYRREGPYMVKQL